MSSTDFAHCQNHIGMLVEFNDSILNANIAKQPVRHRKVNEYYNLQVFGQFLQNCKGDSSFVTFLTSASLGNWFERSSGAVVSWNLGEIDSSPRKFDRDKLWIVFGTSYKK